MICHLIGLFVFNHERVILTGRGLKDAEAGPLAVARFRSFDWFMLCFFFQTLASDINWVGTEAGPGMFPII